MAEEVKEEKKPEKKKGFLGKLKEGLDDKEEQLAIFSTFVRLGVLVWSGGILTLNYVTFPGLEQQKIDPTFKASVFTGVLATFGIQTASKKGDGTMKMANGGAGQVSKQDLEKLIEKASQTAPAQVIRIEQAPIAIQAQPPEDPKKYTM